MCPWKYKTLIVYQQYVSCSLITIFILIYAHISVNSKPPWFETKTHDHVNYVIIKKLL